MIVEPYLQYTSKWTKLPWHDYSHRDKERTNEIHLWLKEQPGGRYHVNVSMWPLDIRFERKEDATWFVLRWS